MGDPVPASRATFQRMEGDDIAGVSSFIKEAWKEAGPGAMGWSGATDEDIAEISSERFLRAVLVDRGVDFFVAELEGKVVGMASNRQLADRRVELSGIVILQSLVGRGLGTGLYSLAEGAARGRGAREMLVKTESGNLRALSFYLGKGFKLVDEVTERIGKTDVRLARLSKKIMNPM